MALEWISMKIQLVQDKEMTQENVTKTFDHLDYEALPSLLESKIHVSSHEHNEESLVILHCPSHHH